MGQARRFFVSIEVPDRRTAARVLEYGFDFFEEGRVARDLKTGREAVQRLGGLLSLEQVEQLVRAGIPVLVREDATPYLSRPVPTAEFDEWLEDFEKTFPAPKGTRPLRLTDQTVQTAPPTSSRRRKKS